MRTSYFSNSWKFIVSNFPVVAGSQAFLNLESQKVAQWICCDEIAVSSEEDVFEIIVKWVSQNITRRQVRRVVSSRAIGLHIA